MKYEFGKKQQNVNKHLFLRNQKKNGAFSDVVGENLLNSKGISW